MDKHPYMPVGDIDIKQNNIAKLEHILGLLRKYHEENGGISSWIEEAIDCVKGEINNSEG